MFLTEITPKVYQLLDLSDADENHATVWSFFPGHDRNDRPFHFRTTREAYYVKSKELPVDTSGAFNMEVKNYDLREIEVGEVFAFKVLVNAVVRKDGVDHDVVTNYKQSFKELPLSSWPSSGEIYKNPLTGWFKRNESKFGFTVKDFSVRGLLRMPTKNYHIMAHDLSGTLIVTDPKQFLKSLYDGIGDKRDRGCGLLMVRAVG